MSDRAYFIGGWLLLVVVCLVAGVAYRSEPQEARITTVGGAETVPAIEAPESAPIVDPEPSEGDYEPIYFDPKSPTGLVTRTTPVFSEWKSIREGRVGRQ